MGRAIEDRKDIDKLQQDVKQLKTAFDGLASTVESLQNTAPVRKNVDLHKKSDSRNIKAEGKKPKKELVEEAEA